MAGKRLDDEQAMKRALELAERGRGAVEPNPMVGAVLVRDGQVIAEGYHASYGQTHAEVAALEHCRDQGIDPAGATLYVNLEPCCHHGMTPPCVDALRRARIATVIAAMIDPFDMVAGKGISMLSDAGIDVKVGLCEAEARQLNEAFIKRVQTGLPWVIVKWAQTLDGKIATSSGDSRWISNSTSRRRVHQWRGRVDAVMVGIGTALSDDPQLTARDVEVQRRARRVVVDLDLLLPLDAKMLNDDGPTVIVATGEHAVDADEDRRKHQRELERRGAEVVMVPACCPDRLDLRALLAKLTSSYEATNVLVEGGASLIGSLFEQNLVDQVLVFVGPKISGDVEALDAVRGLVTRRITDTRNLALHKVERIEDDVLLDYRMAMR